MMKQFRDQSKAMRQKWREFKVDFSSVQHASTKDSVADLKKQAHLPIDYDKLIHSVLATNNVMEKKEANKPSITVPKKKPAWARTEEENTLEEDKEIDELVDFMDQFDAKEFVEDVEVKNILSNLQHKVAELQQEANPRNLAHSTSHAQIGSRPHTAHVGYKNETNPFASDKINSSASKRSFRVESKPSRPVTGHPRTQQPNIDMDKLKGKIIKSIADSLLKNDPVKFAYKELAKVHSNASIRRMIEGLLAKYFKENHLVLRRYVQPVWKSPLSREPKTIIHENFKLKTATSMQNLPYMYPSPLI